MSLQQKFVNSPTPIYLPTHTHTWGCLIGKVSQGADYISDNNMLMAVVAVVTIQ